MKTIVLFLSGCLMTIALFAQNRTQIIVHAPVLGAEDTLVLYMQKQRLAEAHRNPFITIASTGQKTVYKFNIDEIEGWTWINMNLSYQKLSGINVPNILEEFLLEQGDSVDIYLSPKNGRFASIEEGYDGNIPMLKDNWNATFSGRGARKFEVLWTIKVFNDEARRQKLLKEMDKGNILNYVLLLNRMQSESLALLRSFEHEISQNAYDLLELQIKGQFGYELGKSIETLVYYTRNKDEGTKALIQEQLAKYLRQGQFDLHRASDVNSPMYIDYLTKYVSLAFMDQYKGYSLRDGYFFVKDLIPPSAVRDRILASFLLARFQYDPQRDVLEDAFSIMKDPYSLERVVLLRSLLKGEKSYAFVLPDVHGKYHSAEDFKGKVIFMDFWYAACTPCRQYMQNVVKPVKEHFRDNGDVVFITVSTDDVETFSRMVERSDFLPKDAVHLYTDNQYFKHPAVKHYQIRSFPYPLLIDRSGKVVAGKESLSTVSDLIKEIELALQ